MATSRRRLVFALGLIVALAVSVGVAPVAAHDKASDLPERIDLPNGFQPEGIESLGKWLYAGSLANGAIWRANARTGEGDYLVDGIAGNVAVGLHIDRRGRLWVAGGPTGQIRVYNARTGELLQTYQFQGTGFLNDLDISRNAVYATDSVNQQLAVIPLGRHGKLPPPSAAKTMPLTGDLEYETGFNANGIAARGGWLVLVQSNTGLLFRVNPRTGVTRRSIPAGTASSSATGSSSRVGPCTSCGTSSTRSPCCGWGTALRKAKLVGEITAAPGVLSVPTTATVSLGALWVVNARFGTPPGPDVPYWITRLPLRP